MALFSVQFSACALSNVNVFTILDTNRLFPSIFRAFLLICTNIYYNLTFYSNFSPPTNFSEELEPMFVIHNISIATADDVTYFGDDVKYIPCILPRAITIWGCCLNWLEKTIVSDHFFCQFVVN